MPRDSSGVFNLSGQFAIPNAIPSSTTINGYMDDIGGEITNSLDRDGKSSMRTAMKMGGFKITGLADGTLLTDAATVGQVTTTVQGGISSVATAVAGTADAITATFTPPFLAYTANMRFLFRATGPNTVTAPTINVDTIGNRTIKRQGGAALAPYDIPAAGYVCEAFYDGTDVILLNRDTAPTGTVFDFAGATAPPGYLMCDGAWQLRTTYAALFAVIGTIYGAGDGSTSFALPDCRGRASIGVGTGSGLTNRTLGQWLGAERHQLSWNEMPSHVHSYTQFANGPFNVESGSNHPNHSSVGANTGSAGADQSHNNMQPSIGLNKIIKT